MTNLNECENIIVGF